MKIVYFYQYFSTPKGSWGTRVYDFASEWVKKGHEVTVVSSIYSKSDLKTKKFIDNKNYNGINVKVLNILIDNKQNKIKRILSFIKYALLSSWYALTLPADIIIASSGPITVGLPGLLAKFIRRKKLVFEVRDIWPEGAIKLGKIKNPIIIKIAYLFEKICYKNASLVVTLSPGMKDHIILKHKHKNIISVTNAANIELFSKAKIFNQTREISKNKYALYTGNIGEVNNSYWLYNAAIELKKLGRSDIKIILIGDGQQKEELKDLAKKNNLDNFLILDLMSKEKIVPIIQNALVSLVPLKDIPILNTSSPNKFFESIAAGTKVIQNTTGWIKKFLEENQAGYTLDGKRPKVLADKLIKLSDQNKRYQDIESKRLQKIAKKYFDKNILAQKMLKKIQEL